MCSDFRRFGVVFENKVRKVEPGFIIKGRVSASCSLKELPVIRGNHTALTVCLFGKLFRKLKAMWMKLLVTPDNEKRKTLFGLRLE